MSLEEAFLRVPTTARFAPVPVGRPTRTVEVKGDTASVEVKAQQVDDDAGHEALEAEGLNPDEWVASGFRTSTWTMSNGEEGVSKRFSFRRRLSDEILSPDIEELLSIVNQKKSSGNAKAALAPGAIIIPVGDMQYGKGDYEDHLPDALDNTLTLLDDAALEIINSHGTVKEIALVWVGDHVEGFNSQGGSNIWRTKLTLSEQIRLTRRVMLWAVDRFAPLCETLHCIAVPGNHGEAVRVGNRMATRYDDSHDTEALIAVSEACSLNDAYQHVKFYVPDTDELTVQFEIAGLTVLVAHGDKWRKGKHFEWWQGQTFHGNAGASATLLICGHLHHLLMETSGERMFVQIPALESGSAWYAALTGTRPHPGLLLIRVRDGVVRGVQTLWRNT